MPFAMVYVVNSSGTEARLAATTGPLPGRIAPDAIRLDAGNSAVWPLGQVVSQNQWSEVDDLEGRFGRFECGPYPEAPNKAVLLPVTLSGSTRPVAVLVAGA